MSDGSIHAYHLYFPDPWWKRRHHKRRLVQSDFAGELWRTLAPGCVLHLATDVRERFAAMIEELSRAPFTIVRGSEPTPLGRPLTNFEHKYRARGPRSLLRDAHEAGFRLQQDAWSLLLRPEVCYPPASGGNTFTCWPSRSGVSGFR